MPNTFSEQVMIGIGAILGWFAKNGHHVAREILFGYVQMKAAKAKTDGHDDWEDKFWPIIAQRLNLLPKKAPP